MSSNKCNCLAFDDPSIAHRGVIVAAQKCHFGMVGVYDSKVLFLRENPDAQITGVEISPDMVTVAREYIERAGLADRIQFLVGDAGDRDVFGSLG